MTAITEAEEAQICLRCPLPECEPEHACCPLRLARQPAEDAAKSRRRAQKDAWRQSMRQRDPERIRAPDRDYQRSRYWADPERARAKVRERMARKRAAAREAAR